MTTVDSREVEKFAALAERWWDPEGPLRPLHRINPVRLEYIAGQVAGEFGRDRREARPFAGLRVLDIGCGGGLLSEPMARLGADVTGADAAAENVRVAALHAEAAGLAIDYRAETAEALAAAGERFDVVLAMEIVEHVAEPPVFVAACAELLKPGGLAIFSTISRTARSYALAILGAERVLRWLPAGTHDWSRFMKPEDLAGMMTGAGLEVVDRAGFVFDPLGWEWTLSERDLSVNYAMVARAPA